MDNEKTLGEKRVRTDFNVSSSNSVDTIKQKSAQLIDEVKSLVPKEHNDKGEFIRLQSLAMTAYEEAAMWAVKAATL